MTDAGRFGYSTEAWERTVDAGLEFLKSEVRLGRTTTYTEFCAVVTRRSGSTLQPNDFALPHVLGDISRRTHDTNDALITSIVLYIDDNRPGDGFFRLAQELHLLPKGSLSPRQKDAFWIEQFNKTKRAFAC